MGQWVPRDPQTLPPDLARDLVGLRQLLDEALQRVPSHAEAARGTAAVLLDAAAERTMLYCASWRGLTISEKTRFDDIGSQLCASVGERWQPSLWKTVEALHRSRNLVQHVAVPIDPDFLRRAAPRIAHFVDDLIDSTFGRPLHSFAYADGIHDTQLREALRSVEAILQQPDAHDLLASAFRSLIDTFERALDAWRKIHDNAIPAAQSWMPDFNGGPYRIRWSVGPGQPPTDPRNLALMHARNPSEYVWFEAFRDDKQAPTHADVLRGVGFVTDWIVSFETFAATYRTRDRSPFTTMSKDPRSSARVVAVEAAHLNAPNALVSITVEDVPLTYRAIWKLAFDTELNRGGLLVLGELGLDGRLQIGTGDAGALNASKIAFPNPQFVNSAIRTALDSADQATAAAFEEDHAIEREAAEAQADAISLETLAIHDSPLLRNIHVRPVDRRMRSGDRYRLSATLNLPDEAVPLFRRAVMDVAARRALDLAPDRFAGGARTESIVVHHDAIEFSDRHPITLVEQVLAEALDLFLPSYDELHKELVATRVTNAALLQVLRDFLITGERPESADR